MESYGIGEMARLTGVPTATLRYYERMGLIPPPPRTTSGYRRYSAQALARVRIVLRAKQLGFSLSEIGELLDMLAHRRHSCHHQHCRIAGKLAEMDSKIHELSQIRERLQVLSQACGNETPIGACPVLVALAAEEDIAALITAAPEKPQ